LSDGGSSNVEDFFCGARTRLFLSSGGLSSEGETKVSCFHGHGAGDGFSCGSRVVCLSRFRFSLVSAVGFGSSVPFVCVSWSLLKAWSFLFLLTTATTTSCSPFLPSCCRVVPNLHNLELVVHCQSREMEFLLSSNILPKSHFQM